MTLFGQASRPPVRKRRHLQGAEGATSRPSRPNQPQTAPPRDRPTPGWDLPLACRRARADGRCLRDPVRTYRDPERRGHPGNIIIWKHDYPSV